MRRFWQKKGEQKRANRIQNKINVKRKEHLYAYELKITSASERETDQREVKSLAANSHRRRKNQQVLACVHVS